MTVLFNLTHVQSSSMDSAAKRLRLKQSFQMLLASQPKLWHGKGFLVAAACALHGLYVPLPVPLLAPLRCQSLGVPGATPAANHCRLRFVHSYAYVRCLELYLRNCVPA